MDLKTQYEMAVQYQLYESLRLVVSEALGGSTSSSSTNSDDNGSVGSWDELVSSFQSIGGAIG